MYLSAFQEKNDIREFLSVESVKSYYAKIALLKDTQMTCSEMGELYHNMEECKTVIAKSRKSGCMVLYSKTFTCCVWYPENHNVLNKAILFCPPGKIKIIKSTKSLVDNITKLSGDLGAYRIEMIGNDSLENKNSVADDNGLLLDEQAVDADQCMDEEGEQNGTESKETEKVEKELPQYTESLSSFEPFLMRNAIHDVKEPQGTIDTMVSNVQHDLASSNTRPENTTDHQQPLADSNSISSDTNLVVSEHSESKRAAESTFTNNTSDTKHDINAAHRAQVNAATIVSSPHRNLNVQDSALHAQPEKLSALNTSNTMDGSSTTEKDETPTHPMLTEETPKCPNAATRENPTNEDTFARQTASIVVEKSDEPELLPINQDNTELDPDIALAQMHVRGLIEKCNQALYHISSDEAQCTKEKSNDVATSSNRLNVPSLPDSRMKSSQADTSTPIDESAELRDTGQHLYQTDAAALDSLPTTEFNSSSNVIPPAKQLSISAIHKQAQHALGHKDNLEKSSRDQDTIFPELKMNSKISNIAKPVMVDNLLTQSTNVKLPNIKSMAVVESVITVKESLPAENNHIEENDDMQTFPPIVESQIAGRRIDGAADAMSDDMPEFAACYTDFDEAETSSRYTNADDDTFNVESLPVVDVSPAQPIDLAKTMQMPKAPKAQEVFAASASNNFTDHISESPKISNQNKKITQSVASTDLNMSKIKLPGSDDNKTFGLKPKSQSDTISDPSIFGFYPEPVVVKRPHNIGKLFKAIGNSKGQNPADQQIEIVQRANVGNQYTDAPLKLKSALALPPAMQNELQNEAMPPAPSPFKNIEQQHATNVPQSSPSKSNAIFTTENNNAEIGSKLKLPGAHFNISQVNKPTDITPTAKTNATDRDVVPTSIPKSDIMVEQKIDKNQSTREHNHANGERPLTSTIAEPTAVPASESEISTSLDIDKKEVEIVLNASSDTNEKHLISAGEENAPAIDVKEGKPFSNFAVSDQSDSPNKLSVAAQSLADSDHESVESEMEARYCTPSCMLEFQEELSAFQDEYEARNAKRHDEYLALQQKLFRANQSVLPKSSLRAPRKSSAHQNEGTTSTLLEVRSDSPENNTRRLSKLEAMRHRKALEFEARTLKWQQRKDERQVEESAQTKEPTEALHSTKLETAPPRQSKPVEHLTRTLEPATIAVKGGKRGSNRKLVRNAIEVNLLAGLHLTEERNEVLFALDNCDSENYIILFRGEKSTRYRGLYSCNLHTNHLLKLHGKGPSQLTTDMVRQLYRYNSSRKEFIAVATKCFTIRTDAASLDDNYFRKQKR